MDGKHISAVLITLKRQLSTYKYTDGTNQGWGDEIYVTFRSSVGPDTIDVLKYLISTYAISNDTALNWDDASFDYCQSKLTKFPVNFALLEQKNVVDVLKDIAFQCRCALWLDAPQRRHDQPAGCVGEAVGGDGQEPQEVAIVRVKRLADVGPLPK